MKKDEKFTLKPEDVDITLRDWFAGQALTQLSSFFYEDPSAITEGDAENAAKVAYAIADAMLAEREKGGSACE